LARLPLEVQQIKACCADFYSHDWVNWLLGGSFHPGGPAATVELARKMALSLGSRVLDLDCGRGASALVLAEGLGLHIDGLEDAREGVKDAEARVTSTNWGRSINVLQGDAEELPLGPSIYDGVMCECSLCLFPNKERALQEAYRVMRPGGSLGIADVVRKPGELPPELQSLESYVSCVGAALPLQEYFDLVCGAGFTDVRWEDRRADLVAFLDDIHQRVKGVRLLVALGKLPEPLQQIERVVEVLKVARTCVQESRIGYVFITAVKA